MNKKILFVLAGIVASGLAALYALNQGPVLLLRGPSEERIAFVSDRGGQTDIWTMRTDGSDIRPVTNDAADDQTPVWSPDGKELAATSDRRNQVYQIFLSAWDGRYTHDLTMSEGTKDFPVWTADAQELAFVNAGRVYGVSHSGGPEEQYVPAEGTMSADLPGRINYVYGAWSADRQLLLYVQETDQGQQAYVVDSDSVGHGAGGEPKTTGVTVGKSLRVAWSPSGHKVAAAYVDNGGENGILIADLDTIRSVRLFSTKGDTTAPGMVAWSPDGKRLAFEMWSVEDGMLNRSCGIYIVNVSGGKPEVLVKGDAREPSWSPDGSQLAYTSIGKNESRDIWRVNADGTGATNLTKGKGDSHSPSWSPSARRK